MTSSQDLPLLSEESAKLVASLVDLPMSGPDATEVAELLNSWLPAAIELSNRMQDVVQLVPAAAFNNFAHLVSEEAYR